MSNTMWAEMISSVRPLLERYLSGFDDSNATRQGAGLPNHAVWVLGHLALYNHQAADRITGKPTALEWDPEPFAFQSTPRDDPTAYPGLETMIERWRRSLDHLAKAAAEVPDSELEREIRWGSQTLPLAAFIARMIFHNGTHCGQLVDLRRAIGLGNLMT